MIIETIRTKVNSEPTKTKIVEEKQILKCPFLQSEASVKLINFTSGKRTNDTLHNQSVPIKCTPGSCMGALMNGQSSITDCKTNEELIEEAEKFQEQYFASLKKKATTEDFLLRMKDIKEQISKTGTYDLSYEELTFGSKLAWRNASRCIGRIQWNRLEVFDCRNITTTEEMYHAMCSHLEYATNKGNIRSAITLFPQRVRGREDFRLWNPQLLNYAGYLQPDGSVIGDPGRLNFTRICQRLGWKGKGGRFDVLPWVFSAPGEGVKWYEVPEELILMVNLEHPKYDWFAELGIKWYAVPAVADMMLDIGGLNFTAAPFNGWYMATEIGARNLCDAQRYNITQTVAEKLGLDTMTPTSLWKDTALVETTLAVLYSFQKNKVTIVDHHTAAETFMKHMETEQKLRGGCPADWVWIVPPISGSATPVFHQEMIIYNLKPSFEYQEKAWITHKWPRNKDIHLKYKFRSVASVIQLCVALMSKVSHHRIMASILYATETGKSETFARKLATVLNASFNTRVCCMEDYDPSDIESERFVVFVTSTFGSGEPPDNGKAFWKSMKKLKEKGTHLFNLKFSVFALGSSQYPNFCQFGKNLDTLFTQMGAKRIMPVETGDELGGQEHVFNNWLPKSFKSSCIDFDIPINDDFVIPGLNFNVWKSGQFRFVITRNPEADALEELSKLHHKKLFGAKILTKMNLQAKSSKRKTLFIRLDVADPSVLTYEPGDHIAIFPTNPPALVEAILKHVDIPEHDKNKVIQTEFCQYEEWKKFDRLPQASLRTLLSHYLDITTPPTSSFLFLLSQMATHKWDQFRLKRLSEVTDDYEDWKNFRYPNFAEALEMFPSVQIDPTLLISELPLLQPRYYSISSSRLSSPNEVHITCTLLSFRTQEGKGPVHHGVCTSFLNSLPHGEIPCFIRNAPRFRLPENQNESIIMVGAGSGIAPFRSFWCEREAVIKKQAENGGPSRSFGDMFLFFGCRQTKVDNLYSEEIASLQRKGVITRVFNAYSREPGQDKQYVQHRLEVESDVVLNVLENGGHMYVCGDAIMAEDVRNTVNKILMNSTKVRNVDDLSESGKYHEDVFGVLHKK